MSQIIVVDPKLVTTRRRIERVGGAYKARRHGAVGLSENNQIQENIIDCKISVEIEYLRSLDPTDWRYQDHYRVLGLEKLRFFASDEDIRRAYRKIVLEHHPDKRKAKGEFINNEADYFTCITKAYEILGSSKTRRMFDSVDPLFDNSLPTQDEIDQSFYEIFRHYFQLNARWSERKIIPTIGNENSSRNDVETFYNFWYNFKSWRDFSYFDEEEKDKGQDRDERRCIEKENKAMRIKRKKEEMARIRALVDLAYYNDKRIQKFRNEEKEKKMANKKAKKDAIKAKLEEKERYLREARLAKEKADKAEQMRIEQIRYQKEQQKRSLKRERKILRDKIKQHNYFDQDDQCKLRNMEGLEKICEMFDLAKLQELNMNLSVHCPRDVFLTTLKEVEMKIIIDKEQIVQQQTQNKNASNGCSVREINDKAFWTKENMQMLIKAVTMFPVGTMHRWDVIAKFLNRQSSVDNIMITPKAVLSKVKDLQKVDYTKNLLKTEANDSAFEQFAKLTSKLINKNTQITNSSKEDKIVRGDAGIDINHTPPSKSVTNRIEPRLLKMTRQITSKAWTKEEQNLLEQAIKTYPVSTPNRWDRVADCIPNRSKKDCLRRIKELIELVTSKNAIRD